MVIRAAIAAGALESRWLGLGRLVALAYLINSKVNPKQSFDFPNGPGPENIPDNQKSSWREDTLVAANLEPHTALIAFQLSDLSNISDTKSGQESLCLAIKKELNPIMKQVFRDMKLIQMEEIL